MWTSHLNQIDRQTTKAILSNNSGVLSFGEVIHLWQYSHEFRDYFTGVICQSPVDAFFWETPPVTKLTARGAFEFVLVESASLSRLKPDPSPFMSHFASQPAQEVL